MLKSLFTTTITTISSIVSIYINKLKDLQATLTKYRLFIQEQILIFTILFIIPTKYRDFRDYIVLRGLLNLSYLKLISKLHTTKDFKMLDKVEDTIILLVNAYSSRG